MGFKAGQININNILSSNNSYLIPLNQRKYVWDEIERNELFEDLFLIEQKDDYAHFLGSLVFSKVKNKNSYEIIDGQQRLITISVLLCCIVNQLNSMKDYSTANSILNLYLKGNENGEEFFKIERKDGQFFLTQIIEISDSDFTLDKLEREFNDNFNKSDKYNKKFLSCYKYFNARISDFVRKKKDARKALLELKEKIINAEIIEICVSDELDGFRIFETLNARGIPLAQHELVKNFIYCYMRSKGKQQKVTNSWNKMTSNLITENADSFTSYLTHYCSHAYGKIKKNEEFKTIRDKTPKQEVNSLLTSLVENSEYYKYIENPSTYKQINSHSKAILGSLDFFKNLNIRQVRPVLLSLFEKLKTNPNNIKIINSFRNLEVFYFIYVILGKNTTNTIDNTIINLAKEIHENEKFDFDTIKTKLKPFLPLDKNQIELDFMKLGYSKKNPKFKNSSNKKAINYVLSKLEKFYDSNDELTVEIQSIEHVMCDSEDDDKTSLIGNLLPLSTKMNGKIGSKPYAEKVKFYQTSNLLSVKRFVGNYGALEDWTTENIENRTEKIANLAINSIWVFK